jgi:integrase
MAPTAKHSQREKAKKKHKLWTSTSVQHVYRRANGVYYVVGYRQGKQIWQSLGTTVFEVAKSKASDTLKSIYSAKIAADALLDGKPTISHCIDIYREHLKTEIGIKDSTRKYYEEVLAALLKSWPELGGMRVSAVSVPQCREWAKRYSSEVSPHRFNNAVAILRHVLQVAIDRGIILTNPAESISKVTPGKKKMQIPSREDFTRIITEIRNGGGAVSECCADLVEFLAYSGCRVDESRYIKWEDVDLNRKEIRVNGDPKNGTKRGDGRYIPVIPPMETLLADMHSSPRYPRSEGRQKAGYVLAVRECQKAIDRACKKLQLARFTHHDLRHLFATRVIESGVDIPTLSNWLGHADGGTLAMKTYGHLQNAHSQAQAAKVKF